MQKVIKINAFQKGRLVSIVKKIIMIHQLELELKLTPKDEFNKDYHRKPIQRKIKDIKQDLKRVIYLGGVGFEKWLADYGLNIDNFDINVKEGK
tara:strand:+ start:1708 stop:1989 length:282 start_codon:yes stop_codon:yes gene_type:complete